MTREFKKRQGMCVIDLQFEINKLKRTREKQCISFFLKIWKRHMTRLIGKRNTRY